MNDPKSGNKIDKLYLDSLSILYVEDEDEIRDQLESFLKRRCHKVYVAANGKKGLEAFHKYSPNIVITDILMPIMDGLIMAEKIREIHPNVPIIVITAFEEPRYFHKSIELGVHQYVCKPVKLPILETALQKCARILRAEAALKEIEERYRVLFKLSHIAISVADINKDTQFYVVKGSEQQAANGTFVDCNDAFLKLLGYQDITILKHDHCSIYSMMTPSSAGLFQKFVQSELLVNGFTREFELEFINNQQQAVPVIAQLIMRYTETGDPMEIWGVMRDISEQRKIEEKLRLSAKVFESSRDAIIISNRHNEIISVNQAFTEITGYDAKEVIGKNPNLLKSDRHERDFYQQLWESLRIQGYWQGEIWNRRKNGEIYPEWISISQVLDENGQLSHYIAIFSDISDIKSTEQHIEFLANYDPLTQLPNRRLFLDRLDHAIKTANRDKSKLAVLFLDLDHFKIINDSLGHSIGDHLLVEVGQRISKCMREIDSVSRLSGDEFAAVITDIREINDVITVAKKITESIRKAFRVNQNELHITFSIGISIFPDDGDNYEILLKNADMAMYSAKNNGRDNFEFFSPAMGTQALERMSLEGSLRKAVENNELCLYYQPQIDLENGRLIGMEALLRWPHKEMGMIPPDKFIPLAEDTGLIIPIGKWVLEEACRQNKQWQDQGFVPIPVAVNLSQVQFRQRNLLDIVKSTLQKTGLKPEFLELELTESLLMDCSEYNVKLLKEFRKLGVNLSIDDFGTGYSSLSYLNRFPINKLKIDRSFSLGIPKNKNHASITSAIISLGHDLEMKVIAEGVENNIQLNFLRAHQCDEIQGYLIGKPWPPEQMQEMLKARNKNHII